MGITKQYLRWEQGVQFGTIGSQNSGICIINQWAEMLSTNRICASASSENIVFWDHKTCELVDKIETNDPNQDSVKTSPISCLTYRFSSNVIASGHGDGSVRLFGCQEKELKVIFTGHKGFVSCITFDDSGLRVASGGKDTEIVIWDVTNNSGLFRLNGHKGVINKVEFMKEHPWILISASSDTFIKFWDLNTQHCFKTLVGHRSEVWSFIVLKNDSRLISGGSDSELKVWKIVFAEEDKEAFQEKFALFKNKRAHQLALLGDGLNENGIDEIYDDEANDLILVERYGTILRKSSERVLNISIDSSQHLMVCHGKDQNLEFFKIRNDDEISNKVKKRLRKERKRRMAEEPSCDIGDFELNENITLSDEIEKLDVIKTSAKIKAIDVVLTKRDVRREFKIAVLLVNNSIEFFNATLQPNSFQCESFSKISNFGHRNDVRAISISSDNLSILTSSSDSVKLWNKSSCRCINTITEDIQYPLCSLFAPGDKHAILGTKSGKIQILNLTTAQVQSTVEASESNLPIWSISLLPDLTGIVSGSEDKCIKFWSFDLLVREEDNSRELTICLERTLDTEEGVICVKMSPNSKFIAASLLDSTVKIYFFDTFKFFLSLYGHKFPVLCMDISTDNSLIVTGSSDKNIKIWGMDFGDCHRSLFAHDDNIMCLSFIPKTHQFFTASKDYKIKMWDADNFEKITTLEGHHGQIWAMSIAPSGKYLVTASHDKTIRIWNKTNEPLILEEEKELDNEREFEQELEDQSAQTVVAGESDQKESGVAQKKTAKSLRAVERLIESIDIFNEEKEKNSQYQALCKAYDHLKLDPSDPTHTKPVREPVNLHLVAFQTECPYRFMLEVILRIKSNELEETLLQLPFSYIRQLLFIICELLSRHWEPELMCRIVCFIIRSNFGQITATPSLVSLMDKIRVQMHQAMSQVSDLIGINTIGFQYFESVFESRQNVSLFAEILNETRSKRNKKHKKHNATAPILTWT